MASLSKEWPAHFPEDCPAHNTPEVDGAIFRFSTGSSDDWECAAELGRFTGLPECVRAGLSCYRNIEDLRKHAKVMPKFRDAKAATAQLLPKHGKILQTGKVGHHTLWLRSQYHPECNSLFQEIP